MTAPEKPIMLGADFASGPDQTVLAVRSGTSVVLMAGRGKSAEINRMWISGFNASRKADREILALAFETIALAHDAKVERREKPATPGYSGCGIVLRFSLNGVGAMLDIDNLHGGTYALISWFNVEYPARNFTGRFATCVGEYSGRLHHKATSCGADWFSVAMFLDSGLLLAARGEAFDASAN